ncbi:MAG TPA: hypothetical protein VEH81_05095 [Ktedonobacteraceae bacterium]|nr:hypothetical protein [Ktedonobacteraceae bacterium]
MKISKTSQWLSVLLVFLVLIASSAGLFLKGTYARETTSYALQSVGQDIENIVAAATLLLAVYFASKGSLKAFLVWMGVLLALIYSYVIYAFAVHFNSLFLVYVAILGLSFYTLVGSLMHLRLEDLQPCFVANTKARLVSVFLLVIAILFYLQWLSEDIPALLAGKVPQSVVENGLLTNPVHVLDMGLLLPAMVITAMLLWRRKLLGYILAIPLLVFSVLTGIGILAIFVAMSLKGIPTSLFVEFLFAVIIAVSLVICILFAREIKEPGRERILLLEQAD